MNEAPDFSKVSITIPSKNKYSEFQYIDLPGLDDED